MEIYISEAGHVETCAKNALDERDAVSEMEVGPSKPVCRSRLQTAVKISRCALGDFSQACCLVPVNKGKL